MKKKLLLLLAWFPIILIGQNAVDNTIMVIADPHVMAESLADSGVAFDNMIAKQRKMLDMSEMAFEALVDTALLYHPSLVLIPGDLTKDGELASHDVVLSQLERLQEAGIKTLLIPGNHDIGGTAYSYLGEEKTSVETLADTDWESTYAMVYDQAIAKDPHSHSYVAEPLSGVTVIGIDASHNDGEGVLSHTTLACILQQADDASKKYNMITKEILENVKMKPLSTPKVKDMAVSLVGAASEVIDNDLVVKVMQKAMHVQMQETTRVLKLIQMLKAIQDVNQMQDNFA